VLRLLARAIGEADDRERRDTALQMRLDLDPARFQADEGVRDGAGKHAATLGNELVRVCASFVPKALRAARDEHVLEVLAGAAPGAAVHVALVLLLELEAGTLEDLRIEVAAIVDDDHHTPART
jgi:hypothetical protein